MTFRGCEYDKKFTREYLVQRSDVVVRGIMKCGTPLQHNLVVPNGKDYQADFLFVVDEWQDYEKQVKDRYSKPQGLANMNCIYREGRDAIRVATKGMLKNRTKGLEAMYPFFKQYLDISISPYSEIYIQPWVYDAEFIPYVKSLLQKLVDDARAEQIMQDVNLPRKLFATQQAQLEILNSFTEGNLDQEIEKITEKWCWLNVYNLNHKPVGKEYFYAFVQGKTNREIVEEKNNLEQLAEGNIKQVDTAVRGVPNAGLQQILYEMNDYSFARTERIDVLKEAYYAMTFFFEELRKKLSRARGYECPFNDVVSFTTPEIIDFVERDILVEDQELKMRSDTSYAYYYQKGGFELLTDKTEIDNLHKALQSIEDIKEIKGQIAFVGKVTGKVKIVTSMADAVNLSEGEILVSTMTFPEYIHAMKKAAAFVTNEGGITCHAAIIARELKKPCIIGTKIATQVLKDGDLVEVDATSGMVKVLEKAK